MSFERPPSSPPRKEQSSADRDPDQGTNMAGDDIIDRRFSAELISALGIIANTIEEQVCNPAEEALTEVAIDAHDATIKAGQYLARKSKRPLGALAGEIYKFARDENLGISKEDEKRARTQGKRAGIKASKLSEKAITEIAPHSREFITNTESAQVIKLRHLIASLTLALTTFKGPSDKTHTDTTPVDNPITESAQLSPAEGQKLDKRLAQDIIEGLKGALETSLASYRDSESELTPQSEIMLNLPISREVFEKLTDVEPHQFFDLGKIDWFNPHPRGELSIQERLDNTKTLPNGEKILRDHGLIFYKKQAGDKVRSIADKLSIYPEFAYLKGERRKSINGINTSVDRLPEGSWIPLPLPLESRKLSNEQLISYITQAINEMAGGDDEFAEFIKQMITDEASFKEFLSSVFAIGYHEAGINFPGEYVLHRYEPRPRAFSLSHFHILMDAWGLNMRKRLEFTEGQILHPKNSAKVMIAFIVNKASHVKVRNRLGIESASAIFPISDKNINLFAHFYNGRQHGTNKYTDKTKLYKNKGRSIIESLLAKGQNLEERDSDIDPDAD